MLLKIYCIVICYESLKRLISNFKLSNFLSELISYIILCFDIYNRLVYFLADIFYPCIAQRNCCYILETLKSTSHNGLSTNYG